MTPAVSEEMVERGAEAIKGLWVKDPTSPVTPMAMSRAAHAAFAEFATPAAGPSAVAVKALMERLEKASGILANDDYTPPMTTDRARRVFVTEALIEARELLSTLAPSAAASEEHWHTRFFEADVRRMEAVREVARLKADMAELRRVCTARIEEMEATSIPLTKAEIQSGHNRVQWAENLIRQLPTGHNGRDSWLLNYGTKAEDGQ
jgi:hypothetical protein